MGYPYTPTLKPAMAIRVQPWGEDKVRLVFIDERGHSFAEANLTRKEALAIGSDLVDFSLPEDARARAN